MIKSIFGSTAAAAVFALGIATASAQLNPPGSGAAALSPEQRSAIRVIIVERLTDEMETTCRSGFRKPQPPFPI